MTFGRGQEHTSGCYTILTWWSSDMLVPIIVSLLTDFLWDGILHGIIANSLPRCTGFQGLPQQKYHEVGGLKQEKCILS